MKRRKKRGPEKLGTLLLRHDVANLERRAMDCVRWVEYEAPSQEVSEIQVQGVERLFAKVRQAIEDCIVGGWHYEPPLAYLGLVDSTWMDRVPAMLTLERVCWPMRVPEGLQLPANRFHYLWRDLCDWAAGEELALELRLVQDTQVVKSAYEVVMRSIAPLSALG